MTNANEWRTRRKRQNIQDLEILLRSRPMDVDEIVLEFGVTRRTVFRWFNEIRKAPDADLVKTAGTSKYQIVKR